MKKVFEHWLWEEVEDTFNLKRVPEHTLLEEWLNPTTTIKTEQKKQLCNLHKQLIKRFLDWNEDELKMQFIAPLLHLVDYNDSPNYQAFSQRKLSATIGEWELSGTVDWLLASGRQVPKTPYFFLHEYKKEKGSTNDPLGQLLIAMFVAQHLNPKEANTLYGAYIIGKDWYFVVLHHQEYAISLPVSAIQKEAVYQIYKVLQSIKPIIQSKK